MTAKAIRARVRGQTGITVSPGIYTQKDLHDWAALRAELWPDGDGSDHMQFAAAALNGLWRLGAFLAKSDGEALGLAEASMRLDYVNGCLTSPVGFLEGLYIREQARRLGIARELIARVEQWATERGCSELASDALLENSASHEMHRRVGFAETERVVYFVKPLGGALAGDRPVEPD